MYRFVCHRTECRKYFEREEYNMRSYCSEECKYLSEARPIMKDEILALRKLGHSISEIAHKTGYRLHTVCQVIYDQNNKDIENDK